MRKCHIGLILSAYTGYMLTEKFNDILKFLSFLSSNEIYVTQVPRVGEECKPYLLSEFPWLSEIDPSNITQENWKEWVNEKIESFGEFHQVNPMPAGYHVRKDVVEELIEDGYGDKLLIVPDQQYPLLN